jgi:hypothetical protein
VVGARRGKLEYLHINPAKRCVDGATGLPVAVIADEQSTDGPVPEGPRIEGVPLEVGALPMGVVTA